MDKLLSASKLMFVVKSFFCVTLAAFALDASAGWVYVTKTKCCRYVVRYYVKPCCVVKPRCCTTYTNPCNRCGWGGLFGGGGYGGYY